MSPVLLAAIYALVGDVLAAFLAVTLAAAVRHKVGQRVIGTVLGLSAGFIVGAAFLDLIGQAQQRSHNTGIIGLGIGVGLLLMIGLEAVLERFGLGEEEEEEEHESISPEHNAPKTESKGRALLISIGMAIHNVPEALPIGAAAVLAPGLSLLVALVMTVETFAESQAIIGELLREKASTPKLYAMTMWPSVFSLLGGGLGAILAGISPTLLAFALALASGIMFFITGEIWADGRHDAGSKWSSVGLLVGLLLALFTSTLAGGA